MLGVEKHREEGYIPKKKETSQGTAWSHLGRGNVGEEPQGNGKNRAERGLAVPAEQWKLKDKCRRRPAVFLNLTSRNLQLAIRIVGAKGWGQDKTARTQMAP